MAENGGKRARRWESVGRLALRIMSLDIDDIGGLRGLKSANGVKECGKLGEDNKEE